jgi:hypothetical protein
MAFAAAQSPGGFDGNIVPVDAEPGRLDGIELRTHNWSVEQPFKVLPHE